MTEYGEIVEIKKNSAFVKFMRTSACGKCKACGMMAGQNEIIVQVQNELGAKIGDYVAVSIKMRKAIKASALAYVFPLIMLIAGASFGWLLSDIWNIFENTDITMALCALIFAIISFLLLKFAAPLYNKTVRNVYTMVSKKGG